MVHSDEQHALAGGEGDALAGAAVAPVRAGMVVGLGTGRAASRAVRALAQRVEREGLQIVCVATSDRTAELASSLGLGVRPLRDVMEIDYLFDGADEVDAELRMLKGGGGAMTREKIAAWGARERCYLVQERKCVDRLGTNHRLPVEVLEEALGLVTVRLEWLKLDPQLRMDDAAQMVLTDSGLPIIDIELPSDRPPEDTDAMLRLMPGVVGHGLFFNLADRVIVEADGAGDDGSASRIVRELTRNLDGSVTVTER
jgi:ribose 5-phosphate isomerase A